MKTIPLNQECPFCSGTGLVKSLDIDKIPEGFYALNELLYTIGEYNPCCEGCYIMN